MKVGLTGGIASGKSTVSEYLKTLGLIVIDADYIAHQLMQPNEILWKKIVAEFGEKILLEDNKIDRKKLGNIIFNNFQAKEKLNQITHPTIINKVKEKLSNFDDKEEIIIADIPLLIESNMLSLFDEIWLVYVDENTQINRLMSRDNIDKDMALAKINSQISLEDKKKYADRVIDNCGSKEDLRLEIEKLLKEIKSLSLKYEF